MSSLGRTYTERINHMGEMLHKMLRPLDETDQNIVTKGLILYRQNMVSKVYVDSDGVIATVQDVVPVKVFLDFANFPESSCTCPSESLCRHQLAAFFYMYSQVGRVSEWVENWRKPLKEIEKLKGLGLIKAKDLYKTRTKTPDYDEWVVSFQEIFDSIFSMDANVTDLFPIYMRKLRVHAPIEKEWKNLYELIATVHSFLLLKEISNGELFYELADEAQYQINKLHVQALPFAFDRFIEKLKADSIKLLEDDEIAPNPSLELYFSLWKKLFTKKEWREQELERLGRGKNLLYEFSYIFLLLLLKRDEEALAALQKLGADGTPFLQFCFDYFAEERDWKRIGFFIDHFLLHIRKFLQTNNHYSNIRFVRNATSIMMDFIHATGRRELFEKFMLETLPYSYAHYEEYLFTEKQYEKWADLQALLGYQIESMSKEQIKQLEKEAPHLLLPLYHQAVEANIQMKSRGNYRVAVRYLKRLRTLYKKQKRVEDWEEFLNILLQKTKRLRAFQEECVRGKLVEERS